MTSQPIRLGFVGLSAGGSWASRSHIIHLQKSPSYEIVALLNSSEASAKKAADKYDLSKAKGYGSIQDFVVDPNIDMVAVSVKVPDHFDITEQVIKARKDVFVEWPLARNLQEAEYLTKLAKENGVKAIVGLQARQDPAIRKAKAMVEAGELGDILGTTMNGTGILFGPSMPTSYGYTVPIEAGANLVTIPAGHATDAMCYVLGELSDLQATLANNRPRLELKDENGKHVKHVDKTAHDYMAVTGHLKQGGGVASVVYQGGTSQTNKNFYWEINGTKGSLVMEGDGGHVQMNQPRLSFVKMEEGAKLEPVEVEQAKDVSFNVGVAWDAIVGQGEGTLTTFEDAVLRHKMVDAIYRSDETGMRQSYV